MAQKIIGTHEAFDAFVGLMTSQPEGVFFSHLSEEGDSQWHHGVGEAEKVDFDHDDFPFFCVTDFLGEKNIAWKFRKVSVGNGQTSSPKKSKKFHLKARSLETEKSFTEKIKQIQDFQKEGNAWVINLAHEFQGHLDAQTDPFDIAVAIFRQFLKQNQPHTGGFIWTKDLKAISLSPETFLTHEGKILKTFPIKGTGEKQDLQKNTKEQAELNMITDLLRNDLGQICQSVEVLEERVLSDQKNFYHAHSVIQGTLPESKLTWAQYKKLLPAGSISGAPKKRVVEKIGALENFQRDFYTGTFGVRLSREESFFGILIRTLFFKDKHWKLPVGAGITVESDPKSEWQETLIKAKSCLDF